MKKVLTFACLAIAPVAVAQTLGDRIDSPQPLSEIENQLIRLMLREDVPLDCIRSLTPDIMAELTGLYQQGDRDEAERQAKPLITEHCGL